MKEILENNLDTVARAATLALMMNGATPTNDMIIATSGCIVSNVARQFKERDKVDFNMEEHLIPEDYAENAIARVLFVSKLAELSILFGMDPREKVKTL